MDTTTIENVTVTQWALMDSSDNDTVTLVPSETVMPSTAMTPFAAKNAVSIPVAKYISSVITIALLLLGLFGNISIVVVMRRRHNKLSTHATYLIALAISDIQSLLIVTLNKPLLIEIFRIDLRALTVTGCKIFKYIFRASIISSSFTVVLICIERFIAVLFPLRVKILISKKTATFSCCAIFGTVYLISIPSVIYTGVQNGICLSDFAMKPHYVLPKVLSVVQWALYSLIPTLLLFIFTPVTIIELYRQRRLRKQIGAQRKESDTTRISVMLISVFILYFFLICIPSVVFWFLNLTGINVSASTAEWSKTFREVYEHAELINYACHFFLYGFSSREFRKQVRLTFGCYRSSTRGSANEMSSSIALWSKSQQKYCKDEKSVNVA